MVKICELIYPAENEANYKEYYDKFKYELHDFQKWAIDGLVNGNHILITAPTGTGKSMPAEFAIDFFHSKGKKSIYCSPIKSLSNQKFYDFTQKYPHISIGLITGDIKTNSSADVLIMTTEILLNKLYQLKSKSTNINSSTSFEMDIQNELGCVIFDEIHFIGDPARGTVWENSIMLLPKHIQMVGLSATLDNPEKFAQWIENRGEEKSDKIVYFTSKKERTVPLIHYSFITSTQGIFKAIKDKSVHEEIRSIIDKPFVIQDHNGKFDELHYLKMTKMLKLFESKEIRIKRTHVLNQVTKYLTENEMTPAICYVFSIRKLEDCAREVTTNLLEFDSKIPYTIRRECEQIIRKLPNFEEYLHTPEYVHLVSLLEKGVAMHHSKMLPILREIVEILFAKGYIKVLFATESVAIGLNLPVKTSIFTDIQKFDGDNLRFLQAHEYTQAAGRAGRLGLDTVGHVIHLNNLFRNVDLVSYRTMMNGKPQALVSKFKISYSLLLNLIDIGDDDFIQFSKKSMVKDDLDGELKQIQDLIAKTTVELDLIETTKKYLRTPEERIEEYMDLLEKKPNSVNKKRKEIERRLQQIQEEYKYIESDKETMKKYQVKQVCIQDLENKYKLIEKYLDTKVDIILEVLEKDGFITPQQTESLHQDLFQLTLKGKFATCMREVPCLIFAEMIESGTLFKLTSEQLIAFLSCFTNVNVQEDVKDHCVKTEDYLLKETLEKVEILYRNYQDKELKYQINTGTDYTLQYDLVNYVDFWCKADNIVDCKLVLQRLESEKGIFLGEFVKALLKITNVACELEKVAELIGNMEFLSKLKEIPNKCLKYVVTNQSLYI